MCDGLLMARLLVSCILVEFVELLGEQSFVAIRLTVCGGRDRRRGKEGLDVDGWQRSGAVAANWRRSICSTRANIT